MSNPFRKKPHEMNELDRMKERMREIANLEKNVKALSEQLKWYEKVANELRVKNSALIRAQDAYDWLREQEVMLMTPDGVKYLKGDEFDAYVMKQVSDRDHEVPLNERVLEVLATRMAKAMDASNVLFAPQDAIDSFTYVTQGRYNHGNDAGKES